MEGVNHFLPTGHYVVTGAIFSLAFEFVEASINWFLQPAETPLNHSSTGQHIDLFGLGPAIHGLAAIAFHPAFLVINEDIKQD